MQWALVFSFLFLAACGNVNRLSDAQYRTAEDLLGREKYDQALPAAERGLELAQRNGSEKDRWRFRLLKADILIGQRKRAEALAWIDQSGEPPAGREWAAERAHALLLKGRVLSELNRVAEAEPVLARAAVAAREANSEPLAAEVELRQAKVLLQHARFEEARAVFQDVAAKAARRHDSYQEATALGNLGFSLLTESRNDEALGWFEKAIVLFEQNGATESVARTHGNLGNCYYRLGDYDEARAQFEMAQEAFSRTGNRESQQVWIGNAASVAMDTGDFPSAAKAYERALRIAQAIPSPVWAARWMENLAIVSVEMGRWDQAENYNRQAMDAMERLKDSRWSPDALLTESRIQEARGNLEGARRFLHEALSSKAEDPAVKLESHAALARTWVRAGNAANAEKEFRTTLTLLEQRQANLLKDDYKLSYLSSLIRFYQDYVDFLISRGQPGRALEIAESSRSRLLESRAGAAGKRPVLNEEAHDTRAFRRIAQRTHSAVLEYWLAPRHSYLWVITGETIRLYELPPRAEIRSLIDRYRGFIAGARNPLEAAGEAGGRLFDVLLKPAGNALEGGRFLIVPDQDLYSFDLETLPSPHGGGRYWIEDATISLAPSLDFLAGNSRPGDTRPAEALLAIGDVPDAGPQYPHLEYASREIDSVTRNMAPMRVTVLTGKAATTEAYLNSDPRRFGFIHFAAHAMANPERPLDSAVILSGPPNANRLLARNVMNVPLNADLVTISACRSAGGKTYAGEGLVGFAWAFLRAGARNVIAGLWDVGDRSTQELMANLYRNIASGEALPDALREAKLDLIHEGGAYRKPFYWAPFQLYTGAIEQDGVPFLTTRREIAAAIPARSSR